MKHNYYKQYYLSIYDLVIIGQGDRHVNQKYKNTWWSRHNRSKSPHTHKRIQTTQRRLRNPQNLLTRNYHRKSHHHKNRKQVQLRQIPTLTGIFKKTIPNQRMELWTTQMRQNRTPTKTLHHLWIRKNIILKLTKAKHTNSN